MSLGEWAIGDLGSSDRSIQDVVGIDAIVLQSSCIEFADDAGLAAELAEGIAQVIPELIEAAVSLILNADLIVAWVGGDLDQFLMFLTPKSLINLVYWTQVFTQAVS